jgi:DNA-binding CsgD family transcriptional regulator
MNALPAMPNARRARARILDLARNCPADDEFLVELSRQIRLVVPFTESFWSATDPLTALAIAPTRIEMSGVPGQCERFWERELLVQDVNLFRDLARAERPVASLYRATEGLPARSVRYSELRRDLGYDDELRGVFRSGGTTWGMVSLWREEGQPPFSAAEERFVADLVAPIAEAFRRAALLRASASGEWPEGPGLLIFDRHGTLESFNDQAQAWLRELPPTTPGVWDDSGVPVPTEIRMILALTHAIATGVERGVARTRVRSRTGRWLTIHGFPLRGSLDVDQRLAVVIEPAKASEVAPVIVEAFDLSPREQQIAQLLARGLPTGQIARHLYLSPHTVRDYVKSTFEKVGVSSRGELVARLFAEHYVEPLHHSAVHAPPGMG